MKKLIFTLALAALSGSSLFGAPSSSTSTVNVNTVKVGKVTVYCECAGGNPIVSQEDNSDGTTKVHCECACS